MTLVCTELTCSRASQDVLLWLPWMLFWLLRLLCSWCCNVLVYCSSGRTIFLCLKLFTSETWPPHRKIGDNLPFAMADLGVCFNACFTPCENYNAGRACKLSLEMIPAKTSALRLLTDMNIRHRIRRRALNDQEIGSPSSAWQRYL